MKKMIAAVTLPLLLAACQSTGEQKQTMSISPQDLQHHNWALIQIDGKEITTPNNMLPPHLEIGEKMSATGNAGCNNFFGQSELKDNKFRIQKMGMTMKMCINNIMVTESTLTKALESWNDMTLTKDTLTLKNKHHTLIFKLADWK